MHDFNQNIELTRIKFIINRITEDEFKQQIYKHYTTKNKRTNNNRLLETVHVVGVDLIQNYCNLYNSAISKEVAYEATYKLLQEFCNIINYFNNLQEEKTSLYKEKGLRINILNNGLIDLVYNEIPPFNNEEFPLINYKLLGVL
jgi:hypothetical protein